MDNSTQGGLGKKDLKAEAEPDQDDQGNSQGFKPPKAVLAKPEDDHDIEGREDDADHQRQVEQQVQGNRRSDHLGQVAGADGDFAQGPQDDADRLRILLPAGLRQVAASRDPQARTEGLEQHRHQVRNDDDRQEGVPELRASLDVGGSCPESI